MDVKEVFVEEYLLTMFHSNLIKKIREMSEAQTPLLPSAEEKPQAIHRAG